MSLQPLTVIGAADQLTAIDAVAIVREEGGIVPRATIAEMLDNRDKLACFTHMRAAQIPVAGTDIISVQTVVTLDFENDILRPDPDDLSLVGNRRDRRLASAKRQAPAAWARGPVSDETFDERLATERIVFQRDTGPLRPARGSVARSTGMTNPRDKSMRWTPKSQI